MGTKAWDELKKEHYSEDEIQEIRQEAAFELAEMKLGELRKQRGLTQEEVAERMQASQPQLSKIENSEDLYLSTLKRYIEALGGDVEIHAKFDGDEAVRVGI